MDDLVELQALVETAFRSAQLKLARVIGEENKLKACLVDLDIKIASISHSEHDLSAAAKAGATVTWQRWIDQRRTEINLQLATLAAKRSELEKEVRKTFGRREALNQVLQEAQRKRKHGAIF